LGIMRFLQLTLEVMKELFGIMHVRDDEEVVPNTQRMCIGEEEFSLSLPVTVVVSSDEEKVPVPLGLTVAVLLEEEDVLVLLQVPPVIVLLEEQVPQAPLSWYGPAGGRSPAGPPIVIPPEEEEVTVSW
jgi:hypothetical protein